MKPRRRPARAGARNLIGIVDQMCSSASNFLVLLMVARGAASTTSFGAFTVAFTVLTFVLTMGRSVLGVPLATDLHRLDSRATRTFVGRSVACALTLGFAVTSVLLVSDAAWTGQDPELRLGLVILALSAPFVTIQDTGRYVAMARLRPVAALRSDAAWLAVVSALLIIDVTSPWHPSIPVVLAVWTAGAVVGMALLAPVLAPPSFDRLTAWLRQDERRRHLLTDSLLEAGAPLLIALWVTAFASASVLGSIRGASTLMSPLNMAITAVGLALVPEAARKDERGARRLMAWISGLLMVGAAVWSLVLLALPTSVGVAVLGAIWGPAHHVLPVAAIEYVGLAAWIGSASFLRARGQTLVQLRFRYLYSGLACVSAIAVTWAWGTPRAIAGAAAFAAVSVGVASWTWILRFRARELEPAASR